MPPLLTWRQFALTISTLLTVLLTLLFIIAPINEWWAILFPVDLSVYHLQIKNAGLDFPGCPFQYAHDWRTLRAEPAAESLFVSLATEAPTAMSALYGIAGLADLGSPLLDSVRQAATAKNWPAIPVFRPPDSIDTVSFSVAVNAPFLDAVIALLLRSDPPFEC